MAIGLFLRITEERVGGLRGMSFIFHFVAGVFVFFGAVSLLTTFFSEERDGSKLVVRTVRAVGFILLAGVLNGYT